MGMAVPNTCWCDKCQKFHFVGLDCVESLDTHKSQMNVELTPEEIKDCEVRMDAMEFEKAPSSDTSKPIDLTHLERDMKFIARMLHSSVIQNGNRADFHVCEAWEVAKGYLAKGEKNEMS